MDVPVLRKSGAEIDGDRRMRMWGRKQYWDQFISSLQKALYEKRRGVVKRGRGGIGRGQDKLKEGG